MDEATESDVATCKESLQVRALPESDDVAEALAEISAAGLKGVAVGLRLHIKGLTRRLAESEVKMSTRISQGSLRPPTDYKRRFEQEMHRRQTLEARVEALELERDALLYRNAQLKAQLEHRLGLPHSQARLEVRP